MRQIIIDSTSDEVLFIKYYYRIEKCFEYNFIFKDFADKPSTSEPIAKRTRNTQCKLKYYQISQNGKVESAFEDNSDSIEVYRHLLF